MALTFIKPEPTTPAEPQYRTDRRLYFTNDDPPRVVEEGDVDAFQLWVGENGTVSLADAERYGLLAKDDSEMEGPEAEAYSHALNVADAEPTAPVAEPEPEAIPEPAMADNPVEPAQPTEPEQTTDGTDTTPAP